MNQTNKILFYLVAFFLLLYFSSSAPADIQFPVMVKIQQGSSLRNVSLQLKNERVIRSRVVFEAFAVIYGGEKHIKYSDYLFENKLPVWQVARRISRGEHHLPPVSVTIPEGFDTAQIADVFASKLVNFNKSKFLAEAKKKEGYLFPDTYFFFSTANEIEVLQSISANFNKKIMSIRPEIISFGKTEREVIIMASIIEREAKGDADREFISGILWKRLKMDMPLQVDAAPETYQKRGLPKIPISNPGLEALRAAVHPQNSPYLYYLHDKNGDIHYAKNFTEHIKNKLRYLK